MKSEQYIQYFNIAKDWIVTNGPNVLIALVIFIIGRILAKWLAAIARKAMLKAGIEQTLVRFLNKLIYYVLLAAVVIAAADQVGIKTTSFIAILGAAGLAVGLALKDSLANFASGVMLILFQPFKVGDAISTAGVTGKVFQIDIFSTIIMTPDNQKVIIPNSSITSGVITNITAEPTRRIDLTIGIGYDDDITQAKKVLKSLVDADSRILKDPAPSIGVVELADSSVNLIVRPWVKTGDYWDVRLDLTEKIKLTFDKEGISFPYPSRKSICARWSGKAEFVSHNSCRRDRNNSGKPVALPLNR
ncbi:mechanosensitive ion channel protein [Desulfomarina profundi]|uniref:Mechanosensitive ion channel protein n=1 Tax=Desulfomarina profundi TaxID=2772557 RepID=A0A8D5FRW6_9BACT|nr:mechanosensitive ion channel domain-containing protein [Desulfomarina profundi]BCL62550.1 mechanosensitive ion channel protein [Desulfomarina profundi]